MRWLAPCALFALSAPALAGETGSVRGQITDDGGLAIPGAEVVLKGAAIAGEVVVMTDGEGRFRYLNIPPGKHELVVRHPAFSGAMTTVTVRLDEISFVPLSLSSESAEVILVEEALPVIDATRSAFSAELGSDLLQNIPVGRSYQDAVNLLPGVYGRVDTESGGPGSGNPSVRGEGGYGNNYLVDGISTRDPSTKTFGADIIFDAIEDIQVYTDGLPAEFGQATGMLVNVVLKDGGDEHHGTAGWWMSTDLSGGKYDILVPERHQELPTDKRDFMSHEFTTTAGGPIIQEKLWYFVGASGGLDSSVYEGADPDAPYKGRGVGAMGKVTWFITPDLTLRYMALGDVTNLENSLSGAQYAADAQPKDHYTNMIHMLTGTWRPAEKTEIQLKGSWFTARLDGVPMSGDEDTPQIVNQDTGVYYNNYDAFDLNSRQRIGGVASVTQLLDDVLGSHRVKLGGEFWALSDSRELLYTGPGDGRQYLARPSQDLPCTPPDYLDCYGYTDYVSVGELGHQGNVAAAYLQDDWQVLTPLTLNLGVRLDNEALYQNEGEKVVDLLMVAPRTGFAWDITRDSKTLLSGNLGRYYDVAGNGFAEWGDTKSAYTYTWYTYSAQRDDYVQVGTQDSSLTPSEYAEDLRPYHMDKAAVGFEREILPLFALGVRGIWSRTVDMPEDINYGDSWLITNTEAKRRDYRALEFTAERKFDDRWQLLSSWTLSESKGHMPGHFETSSGGSFGSAGNDVGVYLDDIHSSNTTTREELFDSGQGRILNAIYGLGREDNDSGYYGYLPYHSWHQVKINGSYTFGFGTTLGLVYEFDSGHAWQKRGYNDWYFDYYNFPEGRGSRLMPSVHYVDARVAHAFFWGRDRSAEVSLDVFNVFDFAQAVTYYENDDENFGLTLYRQEPRSVRTGLRFAY